MVFADTSGLIALFCPRDARHRQARQAWQAIVKSGERTLTTVFVLAETVTFVRRRVG